MRLAQDGYKTQLSYKFSFFAAIETLSGHEYNTHARVAQTHPSNFDSSGGHKNYSKNSFLLRE